MPEASEFEHWEVEGMASEHPVAAIIPRWNILTTLDMSHNQVSNIDESVVRKDVYTSSPRKNIILVFQLPLSFN